MPFYMPKTLPLLTVAAAALFGLATDLARAERADRNKPMVVESDGKETPSVDLANNPTV
eukprot:gene20088-27507_t